METIKQYRIRNCTVTLKRNMLFSRNLVAAAAIELRKPSAIHKLRREMSLTGSGVTARDSLTRYRQLLKTIQKNPAEYQVVIEMGMKRSESKHFMGKYTSSLKSIDAFSVTNPHSRSTRDEIRSRINTLENRLRSFRSVIKPFNMDIITRTLAGSGITVEIPVVHGTTRYERGSNSGMYGSRRVRYCNEPNRYLTAYKAGMAQIVFTKKLPKNIERHVTVEIEFACKDNAKELGVKLHDAGVGPYVTLKTDGSVRDFGAGYFGHELVVCMPVSKRYEVIRDVLKVINAAGARVNKTCGLHVHLDMRGYDHRKAFSNLVSAQKILYQMVPASRRDNTYCKPTLHKSYDMYRNSSNRYLGINPQSYRKHGTIEVRLHSGTTDYTKITNFVDILIGVGYNDSKIARGATSVSGFIKQHKLPSYLGTYITSRIALFSSGTQEEAA